MTVLGVLSSSEAFLNFLKEFAERKSFSEIRDDDQGLVTMTMSVLLSQTSMIHWIASGPIHYIHWIVKLF